MGGLGRRRGAYDQLLGRLAGRIDVVVGARRNVIGDGRTHRIQRYQTREGGERSEYWRVDDGLGLGAETVPARNRIGVHDADAVLAMYHDQGLPVLKHKGFGKAVNITLGLPIIRTSVDHGTALDLAGTGQADSGSLITAIDYAALMVAAQRGNTPS